jgi:hypothetical protein
LEVRGVILAASCPRADTADPPEQLNDKPFELVALTRAQSVHSSRAPIVAPAPTTSASRGRSYSPWQKVKIDRQIIAIARSEQASRIYSTDEDLRKISNLEGIKAFDLSDMQLPPDKMQPDLPFPS